MKEKQYDLAIAEWKKILDIDEIPGGRLPLHRHGRA